MYVVSVSDGADVRHQLFAGWECQSVLPERFVGVGKFREGETVARVRDGFEVIEVCVTSSRRSHLEFSPEALSNY